MEGKTELVGGPLRLVHMHSQEDLRLHVHPVVELVAVLAGGGEHLLAGRRSWGLAAGDVFAIPPGQAHGYRRCRDLHLVNLLIEPAWLAARGLAAVPGFTALCNLEPLARTRHDFASHLHLDAAGLAGLEAGLAGVRAELAARAPGWAQALAARLELLLVDLARRYAAASGPARHGLLRLESVLRLIDEQLHRPLGLPRLAAAAGVSPSTLHRLFRDGFACTPLAYLDGRRLHRAQELLAAGGQPVAAVARAVGFADPSYFARWFRRHSGRSPRAWRAGPG